MRLPRQFQACFAFFDEKISRAQEHVTPRSSCVQNLFFKKNIYIYIYIYIFIYKKNYTRYSRNVAQEIDKRIEINHIAT